MTEYENSKSDDQLEELLMLTEQMQEELDQKDQTIRELKVQLDESLTLNEKLNSENRVGNIQALKNDLRKTKELLQSEKEKTHTARDMIEECRDKQRQAEQERDYALSHQKKVEIPVEKPVLYQKCGNCNQTAYLKAKERYDTQREKLAGRYKTKTAMYEALMFLLIGYSVSTTIFQMIQSEIFISDCVVLFDTIVTFIQTIAGWIALTGKNMAQISNGISNPVVAGIVYWLIRILICGGCLVGAGIFLAFIGIKIVGLYKKYCCHAYKYYHNGNTYKHGNSYLLWELDKDSIANQFAAYLAIRATGICWNQVVCKGMAGNKGILVIDGID